MSAANQGPPPAYQEATYQQYDQTTVVTAQPQYIIVGGCPICGVGHISDNFTGIGICLAICFFPLGVLCCFLLMEKRCDRCGAQI